MVSKASDDLPEPLSPVITVRVLRGISTEMFFKLCWRAPRTVMLLIAMGPYHQSGSDKPDFPQKPKRDRHSEAPEGRHTALLRILTSAGIGGQFGAQDPKIPLLTSIICVLHDERAWRGIEGAAAAVMKTFAPILLKMHPTGEPTGTTKRTIKEIGQ